jgi:hypothetical protein
LRFSPGSYERQERFTRALTYVLAVVFYGVAYALARSAYGPVLGFVVCSPVLGVYGAWWLVNHGAGTRHWFRWLALRKVDGDYHAFDGVAVRIGWGEGRCRVAAQDVFKVLREEFNAKTSRRLEADFAEGGFFKDEKGDWWFGESALLQWLARRGTRLDRRTNRFRLWLEREAFPPMHRKKELTGPRSDP